MKIYLIRHGKTVDRLDYDAAIRLPNPVLGETGLRQAELLGRRLKHYGIGTTYSSDLKRAKETAQIIRRYTNTDIIFKPQLREIDMGEVHVKGWKAFPDYSLEWQKHEADLPYPQGEAGVDVEKRAWSVLDEIIEVYNHDVAIVTHGGVIMVLLSACLGLGLEKRFRFAPIANCSISTLSHDSKDGTLKIEQVNDTAHLDCFFREAVD